MIQTVPLSIFPELMTKYYVTHHAATSQELVLYPLVKYFTGASNTGDRATTYAQHTRSITTRPMLQEMGVKAMTQAQSICQNLIWMLAITQEKMKEPLHNYAAQVSFEKDVSWLI